MTELTTQEQQLLNEIIKQHEAITREGEKMHAERHCNRRNMLYYSATTAIQDEFKAKYPHVEIPNPEYHLTLQDLLLLTDIIRLREHNILSNEIGFKLERHGKTQMAREIIEAGAQDIDTALYKISSGPEIIQELVRILLPSPDLVQVDENMERIVKDNPNS